MGFTGLALPILPEKGRSVVIGREDWVKQIVVVSLSEGACTNPYNEIGFVAPIFKNIEDPEHKMAVLSKIASIFKLLEDDGLARLRSTPTFKFDEKSGKWIVHIDPVSLENLDSGGNPTPFPFDLILGKVY